MTPLDYAKLAQEAYTDAPDIGVAASASRAIVRMTADGLCVVFPGTDNWRCVLADLDITPFDVAGVGKVYRGFWNAWSAISLPILASAAGKPVTLVGHSLGAAMALMCAAYMAVGGNVPKAVYAFESPRVGFDLGIRTALAGVPLHLFKNGNDLVTDLPLGGYHAGLITAIGVPSSPLPNVADHYIENVIKSLSAQQGSTQ